MTPEQLARLPKHAQAEISRLTADNESLRAKVEWLQNAQRAEAAQSNTAVVQGINDRTPLLPFSNVEFSLADEGSEARWRSAITVRVRPNGKEIEVYGTDTIRLFPQAGNVIHVGLREP